MKILYCSYNRDRSFEKSLYLYFLLPQKRQRKENMAILEKYQDFLDVDYGTNTDTCLYCAKEILDNVTEPENNNMTYAEKKLSGNLLGQKVYKNRRRGLVICKKHIEEILVRICGDEIEE